MESRRRQGLTQRIMAVIFRHYPWNPDASDAGTRLGSLLVRPLLIRLWGRRPSTPPSLVPSSPSSIPILSATRSVRCGCLSAQELFEDEDEVEQCRGGEHRRERACR